MDESIRRIWTMDNPSCKQRSRHKWGEIDRQGNQTCIFCYAVRFVPSYGGGFEYLAPISSQ